MLGTVFAQFGRLSFPTATVTDRAGALFVAFAEGDPVVKLDHFGNRLSIHPLPDGVRAVETMSITPEDQLCLLASDPPSIVLIDSHSARSVSILLPADVSPTALAVGADGRAYIAATSMTFLLRVDTEQGNGVSRVALEFDLDPSAVAVDRAGTLYVADWTTCRIDRISPDGTTDVGFWTPRDGVPSSALACSADGRRLIASGADGSVAQLELATGVTHITGEERPESLAAHVIEIAPEGTAYLPSFDQNAVTTLSPTGDLTTSSIEGFPEQRLALTDCTVRADGAVLAVGFLAGSMIRLSLP
ncbi:hypothetical protein B7R22_08990 [Subtercola boreus]|uniref:SMP-30/Gluconolactonase/LRE-like region domain-containing protein n=1 Tax=Subtercola boreus TaxID=120213 RepID=A0A3E0W175_9MICO|nr:hypothetical protein [Subtercola boreus]RFA14837.1 hypothetical protein B7R22_08990 [Subtercola boreus]